MHYLYQELFLYYEHLFAPQCVIYSTAIIDFSKYLHLRFENQYKQMLNTHENVINVFTYCMSVYMNFCLDLHSGHNYKVIFILRC